MTTTFGERLRGLRQEKRLTVEQAAKEIGVSRTTLTNYENGTRYPKKAYMDAILDYYNVEQAYLDGVTDIKQRYRFQNVYDAGVKEGLRQGLKLHINTIPIYSSISCGTGSWIDEQPTDYVGVPDSMIHGSAEYFANPAEGDSMEPLIEAGDYLVFEKCDEIPSGKIGSFALNGEYYCKRFKRLPDGSAWLFSENDKYDPIRIDPTDDFRTLGIYKIKISKEQ